MKNITFAILYLTCFITSCNSQNVDSASIGNIDISNDDTRIIFAYNKEGVSSIYQANIDGSEISTLFSSSQKISYVNPKFSPDGRKIIFIAHPSGDISSKICVANQDGSQLKTIPFSDIIVTEAIFSSNPNLIYFCGASSFDKSSPIGIRAAHNFDIYSLSTADKTIKKLSRLNSYNINTISEVDSTYILMKIEAGPKGGMYALSIDNPDIVTAITTANKPIISNSLCYHPIFSDKFEKIAFIVPYELYIMDAKTKNAQLVYGPKDGSGQFKSICFYNDKEKILFTKESMNGVIELMSISFNGTDLKKIPVPLSHQDMLKSW